MNGDGNLDIVTAQLTEVQVLPGDGTGRFGAPSSAAFVDCNEDIIGGPKTTCTRRFLVADANDDGAADLFVETSSRTEYPPDADRDPDRRYEVAVWLNDGTGAFREPTPVFGVFGPEAGFQGRRLSLGDVTGDGTVDVLLLDELTFGSSRHLSVLPGDGTGHYGAAVTSTMPADNVDSTIHVTDLDGDRNPDVVLEGGFVQISPNSIRGGFDVFLGDGSGVFGGSTRHLVPNAAVDDVREPAFGDIDEDGDTDIVGGNFGLNEFDGEGLVGSSSTFLGDGAGALGSEISTPWFTQTVGVQLADFDGDGHLDLFTRVDNGNTDSTDDYGHIRFGDGVGHFTGNHIMPGGGGLAVDLDADGRADFVRQVAGGIEVYMNRWTERPS